MNDKLKLILLIDDDDTDNFVHKRVIKKSGYENEIVVKENAKEALEFLQSRESDGLPPPDLIFVDINMPGMNGWEFLAEYDKFPEELKCKVAVTMLSTSQNPADIEQAKKLSPSPLKDYKSKPLTKEMLAEIVGKYF